MKLIASIALICLAVIYSADLCAGEDDPKSIKQFAEMVRERGREGLVEEYSKTLKNVLKKLKLEDFVLEPSALLKNYWGEATLCRILNRVILSKEKNDDPTSDYINANFIDGYNQKNAYIASQAPIDNTVDDFWHMVWEQHCLVIVMVTKIIDNVEDDEVTVTHIHGVQYWSVKVNDVVYLKNYFIKTTHVESYDHYSVTSLEIISLKTYEMRKVSHWQFTGWPPQGVPKNTTAILNFMDGVHDQQIKMVKDLGGKWSGDPRGPPIIVHGGCGLGRTGTYIILDISIRRLKEDGTVDIKETFNKVRFVRPYSSREPDQYVFCHFALIEYAESNGILKTSGFNWLKK